jgi:hypothetical protein
MPTQTLSLNGERSKAAGYHNVNSGVQTFEFKFSNWTGLLEIQGTLALDPAEADWFTLNLVNPADNSIPVVFDRDSTDYDSTIYANCVGNFVWIRAAITTDSGSVDHIRYNY